MKNTVHFLGVLAISGVIVSGLGGCVGMLGDQGDQAIATIDGRTYPPISPDRVIVKDAYSGGDMLTGKALTKFESGLGIKVATISASASGWGDYKQKAVDKIRVKAARLGANVVVITRKTDKTSAYDKLEGSNMLTVSADAFHKN